MTPFTYTSCKFSAVSRERPAQRSFQRFCQYEWNALRACASGASVLQQVEVLQLGRDHVRQRRTQYWENARVLDCSGESCRSNVGVAAPPLTFGHVERKAKRGESLLDVIQGAPRELRGDQPSRGHQPHEGQPRQR